MALFGSGDYYPYSILDLVLFVNDNYLIAARAFPMRLFSFLLTSFLLLLPESLRPDFELGLASPAFSREVSESVSS